MGFTLLFHSSLNYFFPALYLRGVVYTVGAISRDHLDSGDCQDFFLLIVPADEDLVSRNFGQDDALSKSARVERCTYVLYMSIMPVGLLSF